MTQPQAGWYPDVAGGQRWWDGTEWTDHVHPAAQPPPAPAPSVAPPPAAVPQGLLTTAKPGLVGGRKQLEEENDRLRSALAAIGVHDTMLNTLRPPLQRIANRPLQHETIIGMKSRQQRTHIAVHDIWQLVELAQFL